MACPIFKACCSKFQIHAQLLRRLFFLPPPLRLKPHTRPKPREPLLLLLMSSASSRPLARAPLVRLLFRARPASAVLLRRVPRAPDAVPSHAGVMARLTAMSRCRDPDWPEGRGGTSFSSLVCSSLLLPLFALFPRPILLTGLGCPPGALRLHSFPLIRSALLLPVFTLKTNRGKFIALFLASMTSQPVLSRLGPTSLPAILSFFLLSRTCP